MYETTFEIKYTRAAGICTTHVDRARSDAKRGERTVRVA